MRIPASNISLQNDLSVLHYIRYPLDRLTEFVLLQIAAQMGKKKRNKKQLPLSEIKEKDGLSAIAAEAVPCKSTKSADSNASTSKDTDIREIVYNPEWHERKQQIGQQDRSRRLKGKGLKPNVVIAGSHEEKYGGVKIGSVKWNAQDKNDVGEAAEMLSGLALDNKSEVSCDRSRILGSRGLNGSTPIPCIRQVPSSGSSKTNKPQAHITAKKGAKFSYIRNQFQVHKKEEPVQQLPIPRPSAAYLAQPSKPVSRLAAPQPLLVILDLNGTLLRRSKQRGSRWIDTRPHVTEFLAEIISVPAEATMSVPVSPSLKSGSISTRISTMPFSPSPCYSVMIWSSARPENVRSMCSKILTAQQKSRLVGVWARDRLQLSPTQYAAKLPVYKQLKWVWASNEIERVYPERSDGCSDEESAYKRSSSYVESSGSSDGTCRNSYWGQHNTVLLDDSALKARAEPYNVIVLPEFKGLGKGLNCECTVNIAGELKAETCETHQCMPVLHQVRRYLEDLSYQSDVSSYIRINPFVVQKNVGISDRSWNSEKA